MEAHRRHDISDRTWNLIEPHLPGRKGAWGGIARDNRSFINAVFWILLRWSEESRPPHPSVHVRRARRDSEGEMVQKALAEEEQLSRRDGVFSF